jgi:inner membrane protein
MQIRYKPEETPITLAAKRSYLGHVYLSWAQYPITETEQLSPGLSNNHAAYRVRFRDLRYMYPGQGAKAPLGGSVLLTEDLKVMNEQMGMRGDNDTQGR